MIVNMHTAKTHLSKLVARVMGGETIVIARAGKPVARLTSLEPAPRGSRLGFLKGEMVLPDDFDVFGAEEIEELFGRGG